MAHKVFIPEYVPMDNKGEEAIIRGMMDVVFPKGDVMLSVLDCVTEPLDIDESLSLLPRNWFYSDWRLQEFRMGLSFREIYASFASGLRYALNRLTPKWVQIPQGPIRRLKHLEMSKWTKQIADIAKSNYIIAGHDGAFNEYDCHVINHFHNNGVRFGIFGTSLRVKEKNKYSIGLFCDTLKKADFIFCRNRIALEWAITNLPGIDVKLAPDPAFGMKPVSDAVVYEIISREGLNDLFGKPVVMFTIAEPAPIARFCYEGQGGRDSRLNRHHELIAALVTYIVETLDCNVLFLPHCIGPTSDLDDRLIAESIVQRLSLERERVRILRTPCTARELKGIIGKAVFLVGERIHSVIGAVGMHTPYLCLGVKQDTRVIGIIQDMCQSADAVYLLNSPNESDLKAKFHEQYCTRGENKQRLSQIDIDIQKQLQNVGQTIRMAMHIKED